MNSPLVSVVVPVGDVRPWLDECLDSITRQTYRRLEIVLVDDGSQDGSAAVSDTWAARDSRVSVLHRAHGGASKARNVGMAAATGDYLTFVDSDDVVAPFLVERLLGLAVEHEAEAVLGDLAPFEDGRTLPRFTTDYPAAVLTGSAALRQIVVERPRWGTVCKLYRRSLVVGLEFPEGLTHQDLHFAPRVLSRAARCVVTDDVLYAYRQRPDSVMHRRRTQSISPDLLTILDSNISFARQTCADVEDLEAFTSAYLLHASKQLERMDADEWRRNASFRRAYVDFAKRHRRDILQTHGISVPYRGMWLLSSVSPRAFRDVTRAAHWLRARGVAGPSRRSRGSGG